MIMSLLVALAAAQFAVVQKNVQASQFFTLHSDLHKYAESGLSLSLHDLTYDFSGRGGNVGVDSWTVTNDLGADGLAGTFDKGEGDGVPTYGEPNVVPVMVGPWLETGMFVHVEPTAFPDVYRVRSTAGNAQGQVTVETYVRKLIAKLPKVAAVYVDPNAAIDLKGNRFMIDGNDHNPDGTPGPGDPVAGIGTVTGDPAGSNAAMFLSQVPLSAYDQVIGDGPNPSIQESDSVDLNGVFEGFKAMTTQELAPGTYVDAALGDYFTDQVEITYVPGDLQLSGTGFGGGVLLIDGSLTVTGKFTYHGLLIVRGDIRLSGGGTGVHTFGSVMVGQSLVAIETSDLTVSGNADLFYSSEVLTRLEGLLKAKYSLVYYDEE
jgi:hypothetical protein